MALVLAGCVAAPGVGPRPVPKADPKAPASPDAKATAKPAAGVLAGRVLGLDGQPAAGVAVRGFLIGLDGGSLVGQDGGSLIGMDGGSMVAAGAGNLVGNGGNTFRVLAVPLVATTDAQGRFTLPAPPAGARMNVEAVKADDVKAIALGVGAGAEGLDLRLAPTGAIAGRVRPPVGSKVTDLRGVDVYVPGTSYLAKADADGRFTLTGVPVGAFTLVAERAGVGEAISRDVKVASKATTEVADLVLALDAPRLDAATPPGAGPGAVVTLKGAHLASERGAAFELKLGGVTVTGAEAIDATTVRFTVPEGVTGGGLVAAVGGVTSAPLPFAVYASLAVAKAPLRLDVGASRAYTATARDTAGSEAPAPGVEWHATGDAVRVGPDGKVEALKSGLAELEATSGKLRARTLVLVGAAPAVTRVAGGAKGAPFDQPSEVVATADGFFVSDLYGHRIHRLAPDGAIAASWGTGAAGFADGPGAAAQFNEPRAILIEPGSGALLVADGANHRIRRIDLAAPGQPVSTLAGTGEAGFGDGPGASARFRYPAGLTFGPDGDLFVVDRNNHRVRRVAMKDPAHPVTTAAGDGAKGLADGPGASARFNEPRGIAAGPDGRLYVADIENHAVRTIAPDGRVATLAGGEKGFDDGEGARARFNGPRGIAVLPGGFLLGAAYGNHAIRLVSPSGVVRTWAGTGAAGLDDGPADTATFRNPLGLAFGPDGALWVTDHLNHAIRRVGP